MGLYDLTFYDLICRNAICYRNRIAFMEADDGSALTFENFKDMVDRLACGLQGAGIRKGDRIGAIGKNSREFFLLYGAAAALGAVMLPVNWRLSLGEMFFNLNDGEPSIIFSDPEYQPQIESDRKKLSGNPLLFSIRDASKEFQGLDSLLDNDGNFVPSDVASNDGFVIIHTAAVAGRPRGALLSHNNLLCSNLHFIESLKITPDDVHLNLLPVFHIAGLAMLTSAFHAGALNLNMSRFDAVKAVNLIDEKQISFFFDFTPILSNILDQQAKTGKNIRSLRAVIGLDVPDTIEKYQQLSGGTFYTFYGQTETSCLATIGRYNERPGAAGKPVMLGNVQLLDDKDSPVAIGDTGEIAMRGPMVFKGYWGLQDDNSYTFRNGWHHTGDLGRFDEDGYLWYAGRKPEKELIKPGGENVYPAEVENAILQHPAVEKCVVFGVPDPKWKEGIKAVCLLKQGATLTAEVLIKFVGSKIAGYKKPQYVQFVSEFPLKPDGSPDRIKIKELFASAQKPS
ncbi:MAG TPA: AMP-binding protein [Dissulfurispiraceae bacterium]|nr:AMP-binding protein [Dissulfurispiraceae bacterium]